MHPDINQAILQLLTNEGELSLPHLGTFKLKQQASTVSTIEGRTRPPAKLAVFNNNLMLDDGKLLRYLVEVEGLDALSAQDAIDAYIEKIVRDIQSGKMINIDGLGRLFKDHTGEVRFNASDHNLDKSSFGLPDVSIKPIIRTERTAVNTAKPAVPFESTIPEPLSLKELQSEPEPLTVIWGWIREHIITIAVITAIIFVGGLYIINQRENNLSRVNKMERTQPPQPNDRVAPPPSEQPAPQSSDITSLDDSSQADEQHEPDATNNTIDANTEQYAIIGLYRLGNESNVGRAVQRISEAGYEPYTKVSNKLTRVGVKVYFSSEHDLDLKLTAVRRKFTQDAFILEKNGQRYRQ